MDKFGKIVTLCQRELFKKIPRLGTFCTQSVNEGLRRNLLLLSSGRSYMALSREPKIPRILIRYRSKDVFHQSLSDDFSFRSSRSIVICYFTRSYPSPRVLWVRGSNVDVTVIGPGEQSRINFRNVMNMKNSSNSARGSSYALFLLCVTNGRGTRSLYPISSDKCVRFMDVEAPRSSFKPETWQDHAGLRFS